MRVWTTAEWDWKKAGHFFPAGSTRYRRLNRWRGGRTGLEEAEDQLPFSAYLRYEEGVFLSSSGQKRRGGPLLGKGGGIHGTELRGGFGPSWGFLLKMEGSGDHLARKAFVEALQIHEDWKDKPIDGPERPMLAIPDEVVNQIRGEVRL